MQDLAKLKIPEGWKLEQAEGFGDQAYLTTPSPSRYIATIDFANRGFRSGMSVRGSLHGDDYLKKTKRKRYSGRGWAQVLVDDVVAHLREIL